jgi:type II secretory pathway pseudopilin PulG
MSLLIIPFLIVAAIAIPNLLRARIAANESSAVGSLRTISVAAVTYSSEYGNGFPPSLTVMDGVGSGSASCDHAQLIDTLLASGEKNGYVFTYTPQDVLSSVPSDAKGCTTPGANGFTLNADPITQGTTGQRGFFVDETGVIRYSMGGAATVESPPIR